MIIALDLDNVLEDFGPPFTDFCRKNYTLVLKNPNKHLLEYKYEGTKKEWIERAREFLESGDFWKILPVRYSQQGVNMLRQQGHGLFVLTARYSGIRERTLKSLDNHFDGFPRNFFTGQWFEDGVDETKEQVCIEQGASLIIEDNLTYLLDCVKNGIYGILLDYPWNQCKVLPEKIKRARTWQDIPTLVRVIEHEMREMQQTD